MPAFVLRAADRHVCVEGVLIILAELLQKPSFPDQLQEIAELYEAGVLAVQFGDELREFDLAVDDVDFLEGCFEVVDGHQAVAVVVEVFVGLQALVDLLLGQCKFFHF